MAARNPNITTNRQSPDTVRDGVFHFAFVGFAMHTKYLLIGGGLAASQASKQLHKHDESGSVTMICHEPRVPYDRPPLSKQFLRGDTSRDKLEYESQGSLEARGVQLLLGREATRLDLDQKQVCLSDGRSIHFEKALIATGGRPARLDFEGAKLRGVHYLRTLDDAEALVNAAGPGKHVVIVGGGFIGMEAAASLTQRGTGVSVVEAAPRVWSHFAGPTVSGFFQQYCEARGVIFCLNDSVSRILGDGRVESLHTAGGREIDCDAVLIAVGIVPNVELAASAGLDVDNGIVVDQYLRTSHPEVFAAGDVVNFPDPLFAKRRRVEHWGHAEYGGQIAGQNMTGAQNAYALLSYVWSDVFDLHLEFAGDESEHDRAVIRGDVQSGSFSVLYLKNQRLTAYFSVNGKPKEFSPLKKLIRRGVSLEGEDERLADSDAPLRDLL
jgi:NADPH-dependent 2,4-dienoyl-CoA reductase/sulfur reductase-like enzyme